MPDGSEPEINSQEDVNKLFETWTITPEQIEHSTLEKVDSKDWLDASTTIFSLGLQNSQKGTTPLATGDIFISLLNEENTDKPGESILTEEFVVISWMLGLSKQYLILPNSEILGFESINSTSAEFAYSKSFLVNGKRREEYGHTQIQLACRFGNDGHKNRRTVSFWFSYAAFLKKQLR